MKRIDFNERKKNTQIISLIVFIVIQIGFVFANILFSLNFSWFLLVSPSILFLMTLVFGFIIDIFND